MSTPTGIGRTSTLILFPMAAYPGKSRIADYARTGSKIPQLICSPEYLHAKRTFGVWSLPSRKDGKIADAQFQAFQPDGTPKDKEYGKDGSRYAVAQKVVSTGDDYVAALIESGSPAGVDVVSGATYLHDQFVEAAEDALSQAK